MLNYAAYSSPFVSLASAFLEQQRNIESSQGFHPFLVSFTASLYHFSRSNKRQHLVKPADLLEDRKANILLRAYYHLLNVFEVKDHDIFMVLKMLVLDVVSGKR